MTDLKRSINNIKASKKSVKLHKIKDILCENDEIDISLDAVIKNWKSLGLIKEQTEEMCLIAIKQDWQAFLLVKEQNEKICLVAIKKNWKTLEYIQEQTEEMCLIALQKSWEAIKFIKKQTEEMCLIAINKHWKALEFVKEQNEEICWNALRQSWESLEYINDQTEEMNDYAIEKSCHALKFVRNQTKDMCLDAIEIDFFVLSFVRDQTEEICLNAVEKSWQALKLVKEQTEELCLIAIQQNFDALQYVKKYTYYIFCLASHRFKAIALSLTKYNFNQILDQNPIPKYVRGGGFGIHSFSNVSSKFEPYLNNFVLDNTCSLVKYVISNRLDDKPYNNNNMLIPKNSVYIPKDVINIISDYLVMPIYDNITNRQIENYEWNYFYKFILYKTVPMKNWHREFNHDELNTMVSKFRFYKQKHKLLIEDTTKAIDFMIVNNKI